MLKMPVRSLMIAFYFMSLGIVAGQQPRPAEDTVASLVPYLPASANVVAVIRVEKLLNSPRGRTEGWAEKQQDRFLAGASSIPPEVDTLVVGMHVRPQIQEMVSSVGLALIPQGIHLEGIAQREGDLSVEMLGGKPSVQSKFNAYYVELSKTVLGIVSPAARQDAARYVRQVSNLNGGTLPNYLTKSSTLEHQIIIAMDLKEMLDPAMLREDLEQLDGVRGNAAMRDELLKQLEGVEGVRFCADVDVTTQATLTVDFSGPTDPSSLLLKGLVMRIISDTGLHLAELETAAPSFNGHSLTFTIPELSDPSLRLILSMMTTPAPVPESSASLANRAKPDGTPNLDRGSQSPSRAPNVEPPKVNNASTRYVRTVNQCLDDLQQANKRNQDPSQNSTWYENIARKIEKLSTRGVDPDAVAYGSEMSRYLHGLAASLRGVAVEIDTVQKTLVWKSTYDPGYTSANVWGGYGYRAPTVNFDSNLQQVRERQAEAVIQGEKVRQQTWEIIDNERRKMSGTLKNRYEPQ